jgi:hypothetical protein
MATQFQANNASASLAASARMQNWRGLWHPQ